MIRTWALLQLNTFEETGVVLENANAGLYVGTAAFTA